MSFFDKIKNLFRPMPKLSCEQANGFIIDYLEGRLPEETRSKFDAHMKMCPCCTPFLEQYQTVVRLVAEDGKVEVPEDITEHTLKFLRANIPALEK